MMGGSQAHEFMVLNPAGEDVLVLCEACGYAANRQVAPTSAPVPPREDLLPVEEVETPGRDHDRRPCGRSSASGRADREGDVLRDRRRPLRVAIVRGDYDVNETKLVNAIEAMGGLRPAQVEEIRRAGMEPGYGSPVGAHDTVVVVDELAARSPNLVAGANRRASTCATSTCPRLPAGRHRRHRQRPRGRRRAPSAARP